MIHPITVIALIESQRPIPVVDVRTPLEFAKGHIPCAFNIPLFSDDERVLVGTTYKQNSREAAILLGFDLTGNKWSGFIRQALEISPQKKIAVHCWRGGMRSRAMAWALDLYGFDVYVIDGGYKNYRKWVLHQFEEDYKLMIVGGMTGSGKTKLLHQLQHLGEQIIDLEDLAQHQGSSYGSMNKMVQPSQEQFENDLADRLRKTDRQKKTWVEDESSSIGKRIIPRPFWNQMVSASLIDLQVPVEQRIQNLVLEYSPLDKDFLIECTQRIGKRLGTEQTKHAITAITEDRMTDFIRIVVMYYDKTYRTGLAKRAKEQVLPVTIENTDPTAVAKQFLNQLGALTQT